MEALPSSSSSDERPNRPEGPLVIPGEARLRFRLRLLVQTRARFACLLATCLRCWAPARPAAFSFPASARFASPVLLPPAAKLADALKEL